LDTEPIVKEPFDFRDPYPYIVVNVGSGVSVLLVKSPDSYCRVSGDVFAALEASPGFFQW